MIPRHGQIRWSRRIEQGVINGHPCLVYGDRPRSVAELLQDAQRWGGREFVVQGARRFTGLDHARAVSRVAHELRKRGVQKGSSVIIAGFNHIEWLISFWALQCLGAMVVLGNAWWSEGEVAHAVHAANPVLTISDRDDIERLVKQSHLRFSDILRLLEIHDNGSETLPLEDVHEEDPAVVVFSSGTTGQPKGVVMSHRSVIANLQNLMVLTGRLPCELPPDHVGTVSLVTMPMFHMAGLQIFLITMLSGGKLIFLQGRFDPGEALQLIETEKVRAWGCVPTMISRVLQHERFAEFDTSTIASIQMGGAPIPKEVREQVQKHFPNSKKRVGSMYGLTEAGGVLAAGSGAEIEGRPACVGRPLPCVEIRIDRPDADGTGEIVARTPTATSGYLGDPTPITDPEGWLFSGDLGRIDEAGRVYVLGRSKDIIIRGGENIASLHVENCLRACAKVLDVAVVPLPHIDLGEEVGAAIVIKPGEALSVDELRSHAAQLLAQFEVPSQWWITHEPLPTNASGKVVKREVLARWPHSV